MGFEAVFHPYTLIYVTGFGLMMVCTQMRQRRRMMFVKFLADSMNGTYTILMGGLSGGLAGYIAGTGGLIQAMTPDRHLKKTLVPRLILACCLVGLSLWISYHRPIDLLPMAAVVVCRFMELHHNPERIRLTYFLTTFLWMFYFYTIGVYLMMATSMVTAVMFLIGLIRHRPGRLPPEAAAVSFRHPLIRGLFSWRR